MHRPLQLSKIWSPYPIRLFMDTQFSLSSFWYALSSSGFWPPLIFILLICGVVTFLMPKAQNPMDCDQRWQDLNTKDSHICPFFSKKSSQSLTYYFAHLSSLNVSMKHVDNVGLNPGFFWTYFWFKFDVENWKIILQFGISTENYTVKEILEMEKENAKKL